MFPVVLVASRTLRLGHLHVSLWPDGFDSRDRKSIDSPEYLETHSPSGHRGPVQGRTWISASTSPNVMSSLAFRFNIAGAISVSWRPQVGAQRRADGMRRLGSTVNRLLFKAPNILDILMWLCGRAAHSSSGAAVALWTVEPPVSDICSCMSIYSNH
jgi:hypothetical protein